MLGFMHYDRDGAPAFVFDIMQPERPKVDRAVLYFVKGAVFDPADFTIRSDGVCRLNPGNGADGGGEGVDVEGPAGGRPVLTRSGRSGPRPWTPQLGGLRSYRRRQGRPASRPNWKFKLSREAAVWRSSGARPRAWKLLLGVGRGSRKLSHPRRPSAQDCGWSGVAPTERRSDESLFHASERGHLYETLTGNFLTSDGRKFSILRHVAEDRIGEAGATRSMSGAVNQ
jgi:hypothetical protein